MSVIVHVCILMQAEYWIHLDHTREVPIKTEKHAERNTEGLVNLEPRIHDDHRTGLSQTRFWVTGIVPYEGAVKYTVELHCDHALTPWCEDTAAGESNI